MLLRGRRMLLRDWRGDTEFDEEEDVSPGVEDQTVFRGRRKILLWGRRRRKLR